ncbi:MAG: hypothetical protein B7Z58_13775 [Acidiphilium sp. 37-64-53]|uniref:hypothetical protein n=2 Tax=Acidocellaceae TaxID=3385905 RepID=UPI000BDC8297|nr:hypothetical protein [Acidiphilium sp.]OYW00888.1 MAG: hypothetical protein B7Z58_13775 [Acidiphilium sp. 37-64-53]OZB27456.1 MAG: hypothetical protein B7X49_10985 [Acidiphilium sp. 34-64-41]HQT86312.1 hypothetical protein [Acidiphilium rubrum]
MLLPRMRRYFIIGRLLLALVFLVGLAVMAFEPAARPHGVWLFLEGIPLVPSVFTAVQCICALFNPAALDRFPELRWMLD